MSRILRSRSSFANFSFISDFDKRAILTVHFGNMAASSSQLLFFTVFDADLLVLAFDPLLRREILVDWRFIGVSIHLYFVLFPSSSVMMTKFRKVITCFASETWKWLKKLMANFFMWFLIKMEKNNLVRMAIANNWIVICQQYFFFHNMNSNTYSFWINRMKFEFDLIWRAGLVCCRIRKERSLSLARWYCIF